MGGWIDRSIAEWAEWMDGWIDGWADGWIDRLPNELNGWVDA